MSKRFWLCLVGALLIGQKTLAQEGVSPEALLKEALEKMPQCGWQTESFDVIGPKEEDKVRKSGKDGEKDSVSHLLTLENLFKPGRFELTLVREAQSDGEENFIIISFKPKPEKEHLGVPFFTGIKPRAINWAMNRMSGEISIDPLTGGIVRIRGEASNLKGGKFGLFKGTLYTLWLKHEQKLVENTWIQRLTEARVHYDTNLTSPRNEFHSTTYMCR